MAIFGNMTVGDGSVKSKASSALSNVHNQVYGVRKQVRTQMNGMGAPDFMSQFQAQTGLKMQPLGKLIDVINGGPSKVLPSGKLGGLALQPAGSALSKISAQTQKPSVAKGGLRIR